VAHQDLAIAKRRLRPPHVRSQPVDVARVFDDPDRIVRALQERGPYPTACAFHGMQDTGAAMLRYPWFLTMAYDEPFLRIPSFEAAAREAFSCEIVRPLHCTFNFTHSPERQPPHVDLPVFRGMSAPETPVWLLMNMSYSKLFQDWMVPVASGLVWFWRGQGGEFEYWPDGLEASSRRVSPPMWNIGVMSDNEFMWHRVLPMPAAAEEDGLVGLRASDELHYVDDGWDIRDGERRVAHLAPSEVRISLLWKAYVFKDQEHLASFEDSDFNLDLDQVVDIYLADLAAKGVAARRPSDPLADPAWRERLQDVYAPRFEGQSRYL
jgi:hypothetical protein